MQKNTFLQGKLEHQYNILNKICHNGGTLFSLILEYK